MRTANLKNLIAACILSLAIICTASGDIIYVNPGESIQAAIDDANDGDEIEVAPGMYNEAIDLKGKVIRLHSTGGPEVTIIDATGLNSSVVTCNSGEDANTILEGFTITGGNAIHGGGGMRNWESSPTVTNCTFSSNTAANGGGMYNENSNPVVTDCTFSGNSAHTYGGMANYSGSPTVTNCTFSGNTATEYGGGMGNDSSSTTITNCIFSNNSGVWGGGMDNFISGLTLTNCTFSGNTATEYGGGMSNYNSGSMTMTNCIFSNNSGVWGGGMDNIDTDLTMTNCTFSGNTATKYGGGMYNDFSIPTVTNCILWGDIPEEIYVRFRMPVVTYSNVQGGWAGDGNIDIDPCFADVITENLRLLPGSPCIDAADNNSVPADTADLDNDGNSVELIPWDLGGHPRIIDGDCNDLDVVDMGAYEFNYAYIGDLDYNCSVDFFDFSILGRAWETKEGDPDWDWACDMSDPLDDYIDWRDVAILCDNWLAQIP